MPLKDFICPDSVIRPIFQCLDKCPRPEGRCLSLPTLYTIGNKREWRGKPSTTQCLNPTRLEYLQIKHDFAIDPFNQAFSLLGTRHHHRLEQVAKQLEDVEPELYLDGEVSGILDLLEPINGGDTYRLIDYKTYGSYAVAKQLGLKDNSEYDQYKLALQLNNYRLMAISLGFDVVELKTQITVRDGNTKNAFYNGVNKTMYLLDVPILPDDEVQEYFMSKASDLIHAVNHDVMPELCEYEERWGGRRCKGYCDVYWWCPEGAQVNKVELRS